MKLFEHRVQGRLYFNTVYYIDQIPFERELQVRSIVLKNDHILSYSRFKVTDEVHMQNVTEYIGLKQGDNILWAIDVSCWESAWKKLKKLSWVECTEEVIEL